tara:strand:- start:154 stop:375 length:222 start_codon:yes stop_codon:yes gene_type:complete
MLKKQSIRQQKIYLNRSSDPIVSKDEVILLSENWNENEEFLFRKLLKQGGSVSIQGTHFRVVVNEKLRKLNEQ